jgi:Asp/Glu/hydantoin racemase
MGCWIRESNLVMKKLAIIHTTPVTVEPLKALAGELLPDYKVVNFVDDSILPQLGENGGDVSAVEERLVHYARFAEQVGADAILSACSSVGELAPKLRQAVSIPIVRIDEAMAEEAVRRGSRIGVAATLATTLNPTLALLRRKAAESRKSVDIQSHLVDAAYQRLIAGDREGHDTLLAEALTDLVAGVDVVVLAQASMARVLPLLSEGLRDKFLTSPRLGMERVQAALHEARA